MQPRCSLTKTGTYKCARALRTSYGLHMSWLTLQTRVMDEIHSLVEKYPKGYVNRDEGTEETMG